MTETLNPTSGQSITITVGDAKIPIPQPETTDTSTKEVAGVAEEVSQPIAENEISKPDSVDELVPQGDYRTDPLFYETAEYFGLKEVDYDGAKNALANIVEFVIRDIESNDVEKVIPRIREIEDQIQSPGWEERRIFNVHKYIRLAGKKNVIKKMMKAYEK